MLMENARPEMREQNKFYVKVATETLRETFKAEQIYVTERFARAFKTTQFEIHVEVEELPEDERSQFLSTPKEKYDYMVKKNPHLKDFMEALGLDLDM